MNKQKVIKEVKGLLGQAETKTALAKMLAFLDSEPKYKKLAALARLAQSKYLRASRNLDSGTITNQEANLTFNLVTRTLLKLIDDVEHNQLKPTGYDIQPSMFSSKLVRILTAITVLMGLALGVWIYIEFFKSEETVVNGVECPEFDESSEFNILILPFESANSSPIGAHTYIKRRIDELADHHGLNINIEIFKNYFEENDSPGIKEATDIGTECGARLVIWGVSETTNKGKIVSTSFKYLEEDKFKFTKLQVDGSINNVVDTLSSFSSIQTDGVLTTEIETIIYIVFGLVANRSHHYESAVAAFEDAKSMGVNLQVAQVKGDTSTATLLPQMILADSYIATDEQEKALMTYDTILKAHPNYGFALNNRAVLNIKRKNFPKAIDDLEVQLIIQPEDAKVLTTKAQVHRELEQLDKADKDLEKAEQIAPQDIRVQKEKQVLDSLKVEKRKIKADATEEIKQNPRNPEPYIQRAAAHYSLGEDAAALEDAETAAQLNQTSSVPYIIKINTFQKENDTTNINRVLKEATQKGFDIDDIRQRVVRPLQFTGAERKRN